MIEKFDNENKNEKKSSDYEIINPNNVKVDIEKIEKKFGKENIVCINIREDTKSWSDDVVYEAVVEIINDPEEYKKYNGDAGTIFRTIKQDQSPEYFGDEFKEKQEQEEQKETQEDLIEEEDIYEGLDDEGKKKKMVELALKYVGELESTRDYGKAIEFMVGELESQGLDNKGMAKMIAKPLIVKVKMGILEKEETVKFIEGFVY